MKSHCLNKCIPFGCLFALRLAENSRINGKSENPLPEVNEEGIASTATEQYWSQRITKRQKLLSINYLLHEDTG
jgi:hypothetical protein